MMSGESVSAATTAPSVSLASSNQSSQATDVAFARQYEQESIGSPPLIGRLNGTTRFQTLDASVDFSLLALDALAAGMGMKA
jgi:hypothetical protein